MTPSLHLSALEASLGLLVIIDMCLLSAERQRLSIRLIAFQGILLGLMPIFAHTAPIDLHLVVVTLIFLAVKGAIMPWLLLRTYHKLPPQQPVKSYLGNTASVVAGIIGFVFSLWLGSRIGEVANPLFALVFPMAFCTIFTGLLLIVTRKLALNQMFGYLVMENGIYLLGVPMAQVNPVWLELSVLLDILGGVFVMGIAVYHIHKAFDSTDVDRFAALRD